MSEREEYTPTTVEVREAYAEYVDSADFPTERAFEEYLASGGGVGEFDRAIAAHDRALREQIAEEIEHKREVLSEAQLRILGHLPPVQSGIVAGYTYAARIARGEGSE